MAGWIQVADSIAVIFDTCVHNGEIYACGGGLYKFTGTEWIEVAPELESYYTYRIISYNGTIYGGTITNSGDTYGGCLLEWNGVDSWSLVAPQYNFIQEYISGLEIHNGELWAGVTAVNYGTCELNKWNGSNAWTVMAHTSGTSQVWGIKSFNGKIYGEGRYGQLLEYDNVNAWVVVASQLNSQTVIRGLEDFNNELYVGTYPNGRLFKWNGSDAWIQVAASYYGGTHYVNQLKVFNAELLGATRGTGMGTLLKFTGSAWTELCDTLGTETAPVGLEELQGELYCGMDGGHLYKLSNRFFNLSLSNTWMRGETYLSLAGSWEPGTLYVALDGDATIESVKNDTIESLKAETIGFQRRSWRQ
jgi:hypothetical protein